MTDPDTQAAVVLERDFDAPVHLIWKMWTDPDHFKEWYGPDGATVPVADMDVRVGGTRRVCMEFETPDGPMRMWFAGDYREVIENERLVYTESTTDEAGNALAPADMGMPDDHPTTTTVTVQLERVQGCTRMTMIHTGIPAGSQGAAGWTMALDKLAARVRDRTAE
jgi:uncharacterized protein YndB with AHSA1/START domain